MTIAQPHFGGAFSFWNGRKGRSHDFKANSKKVRFRVQAPVGRPRREHPYDGSVAQSEKVRFWPVARIWCHAEKRPLEPMEVRRRSAMRDLSPKAAPGHERPVAGCLPTGSNMRIADLKQFLTEVGEIPCAPARRNGGNRHCAAGQAVRGSSAGFRVKRSHRAPCHWQQVGVKAVVRNSTQLRPQWIFYQA